MAHFKLNDADEHFLQVPQDAVLIFAGASGTDAWIERTEDVTVRLSVKSVAVATADGATLEVCIDIAGATARGEDGPAPAETQLRASQSVQVVVKAGERLVFKAYPKANNAKVLRTVVWSADFVARAPAEANARQAEKPRDVAANG
jgi:hypothetical protein